jgi:hypothetical protein
MGCSVAEFVLMRPRMPAQSIAPQALAAFPSRHGHHFQGLREPRVSASSSGIIALLESPDAKHSISITRECMRLALSMASRQVA